MCGRSRCARSRRRGTRCWKPRTAPLRWTSWPRTTATSWRSSRTSQCRRWVGGAVQRGGGPLPRGAGAAGVGVPEGRPGAAGAHRGHARCCCCPSRLRRGSWWIGWGGCGSPRDKGPDRRAAHPPHRRPGAANLAACPAPGHHRALRRRPGGHAGRGRRTWATCRSTRSTSSSAAITTSSTPASLRIGASICTRRRASTRRSSSTGRTPSRTCRRRACGFTCARCAASGGGTSSGSARFHPATCAECCRASAETARSPFATSTETCG